MPYRFAQERRDYSDFASGRVFHSLPGRTAFPVRLAEEIFQRCFALLSEEAQHRQVTVYDPCCGGGSLLCALAYLFRPALKSIVGSDADPDAVELARRNLALLTPEGLAARQNTLAELYVEHGKQSHADALTSVDHFLEELAETAHLGPLPAEAFQADALDGPAFEARLGQGAVDIVIADLPYGNRSRWLDRENSGATGDTSEEQHATPAAINHQLLSALKPLLATHAVAAIVTDKAQRARHEAYDQVGTLLLGKRRVTFLRVR